MPEITVLLPTHNRADVLPFAIHSVLIQTWTDFELLIVGDGCTDDTADVVRGFDDSRLRWLDLPKAPGVGYANRNVALREAAGRYIAHMSHDDLWLPDHLELLTACLKEHDAEFVYARHFYAGRDGSLAPSFFNLNDPAVLHEFLSGDRNAIPTTAVMHRRDCLTRDGDFDERLRLFGDWDLWKRILRGGAPNNHAYQVLPTSLHFRANWRTDDSRYVPSVWRPPSRARARHLPSFQATTVPKGVTPQQAVWDALRVDPARWTREVRDAAFLLLDRYAARSEGLTIRALDALSNWKSRLGRQ